MGGGAFVVDDYHLVLGLNLFVVASGGWGGLYCKEEHNLRTPTCLDISFCYKVHPLLPASYLRNIRK